MDERPTDESRAEESPLPGAPEGYPIRTGPDLPEGVEEPGELPSIEEVTERVRPTSSDIYTGDLEAEGAAADPRLVRHGLLDLDLRPDETNDPIEASDEGIPFVPPSDPVVSGTQDDGDPIIASGFAPDALYEPYDGSHHSTLDHDEDEMVERVRNALRADAQTTAYAETLDIEVDGERAIVTGRVTDLLDAEAVIRVAERVTGIRTVEDRLDVVALERQSRDIRATNE